MISKMLHSFYTLTLILIRLNASHGTTWLASIYGNGKNMLKHNSISDFPVRNERPTTSSTYLLVVKPAVSRHQIEISTKS